MRQMGFLKAAFAGVVLVVVVSSGLALGANPFVDVPASKFYADPVDWAYNNALTTGSPAGSDTFKPEDPVTRGENITFNYRYDENIVQPAIADLEAADAALEAAATALEDSLPDVYHASVNADGTTRTGTSDGVSVTHTAASGLYEVEFPPDDIRGCIFQATLVGEPFGLVLLGPGLPDGQITLAEDWDGVLPFFTADADSVLVGTDDSAGAAMDSSFHLSVFC